MKNESINGMGMIAVFQYPEATGIFTVLPTKIMQLEEGMYPYTFQKGLYSNFNPSLVVNQYDGVSFEEYERLFKDANGFCEPIKGMGFAGMMTKKIWPFKEVKSFF